MSVRLVSFDQEKREVTLKNTTDFVSLKDYVSVVWEVTCDGKEVLTGGLLQIMTEI